MWCHLSIGFRRAGLALLGLAVAGGLRSPCSQAAEAPAQEVRKWLNILVDEKKPDHGTQGRVQARKHLIRLGGIAVMPMVEVLKRGPGTNVQLQIAMAMRRIGEQDPAALRRAVLPLATLLEHRSFGVRYWATKALAAAVRKRLAAAVPLLKAAASPDEMIRENVANCLGELSFVGPWQARKQFTTALLALAKDPQPGVRAAAVTALGPYRNQRLVPEMLRLLKEDPDVVVQVAATNALEEMTQLRFGFRPWDSKEAREEKRKAWIQKWGGKLKAQRAARLKQLADPNPARRQEAARGLRQFRGTVVERALVKVLGDPVVAVQDAVIRALEEITETSFGLTPRDPPTVRRQKIQTWIKEHAPPEPKAKTE